VISIFALLVGHKELKLLLQHDTVSIQVSSLNHLLQLTLLYAIPYVLCYFLQSFNSYRLIFVLVYTLKYFVHVVSIELVVDPVSDHLEN